MKLKGLLLYVVISLLVVVGAVVLVNQNKDKSESVQSNRENREVKEKQENRTEGKIPSEVVYEIVEVKEDSIKVRKVGAAEDATANFTKEYLEDKGLFFIADGEEHPLLFNELKQGDKITLISTQGEVVKFVVEKFPSVEE
jgi:hypothetical protein